VTPAMTLDVEDMSISTEVVGSPGTGHPRSCGAQRESCPTDGILCGMTMIMEAEL